MSIIAVNITINKNGETVNLNPYPIVMISENDIPEDNVKPVLNSFFSSQQSLVDMCISACKTIDDWLRCSLYCRCISNNQLSSSKVILPVMSVFVLPLTTIRSVIQQCLEGKTMSQMTLGDPLESIKIPSGLDEETKRKIENLLLIMKVPDNYPEFYSKCMDKIG